jgi:zinc protease
VKRLLRIGRVLGAIAVAAAGMTALPARAAAKPVASPPGGLRVIEPERSTLGNGLTLLLLPRHGLPLVQMQMMIPAGARHDPPGREGVAGMTAGLLSKGTTRRDADHFADEVEFLGGTLAASAGIERSVIAGEFAARDLERGLALMAEMVRTPAFDPADVTRERALLVAGIEATLDDPTAIADRAFARWLYGAHPYGRPASGNRASAAAITRDDLAAFHRARYVPRGAALILSGDFDPRRAKRAVGKSFGSWKGAPPADAPLAAPVAIAGRPILLLDKPDLTQSQIRVGNVAIRRADPGWPALRVVDTVLGGGFTSRLVNRVRVEEGLTYSIGSDLSGRLAGGSLSINTFSRNDTLAKTLGLVLEIAKGLASEGPTGAELEKARNYLAGQYPLALEAPDDLASAFLDAEFYGLERGAVAGFAGRVRAVTADEARGAAARFVPAADAAIVVVGPAATLKDALASFGPVTVRPAAWVIDAGP